MRRCGLDGRCVMRFFGFTLLACLLGLVSWSGVSFGANSSSDVLSSEDGLEQFEWVIYNLEDYDIDTQFELVDWEKLSEQEVELLIGCAEEWWLPVVGRMDGLTGKKAACSF